MKKFKTIVLTVFLIFGTVGVVWAVFDLEDQKGARDHAIFDRMPGYRIDSYETKKFDSFLFKEKRRTVTVEGRFYRIIYCLKSGKQAPGDVQLIRHYTNAVVNQGGTVTSSDGKEVFMKAIKGGKETWGHIRPWDRGDCYTLTLVERPAETAAVVIDAAQMLQDIRATGKVVLYGIYFDSDRAGVKPESEPTLREIARFLRINPKVKLYVVVHTDSVGDFQYNMKLSESRAQAVAAELVGKYYIAESRLKWVGVGPLSPVTANTSAENRVRNRRVELVEQ